MRSRQKHTQGFTLAELLMSIAIIIVLAAVAFPSIFAAQNNMRMVELNNAAEQIANAAQTQMTAMKTSGTWMALIESDATGADVEKVTYSSAINRPSVAPEDTYYMTAAEARSNGIIPSLSIDDAVRNGDYVIEFAASTAQVVSVFYADGKTGFFANAPEGEVTAAQVYYKSSGSRDDDARKKASPMIGYYEGTPAGATDVVALANPVVRANDNGDLCVRNPNMVAVPGQASKVETTMDVQVSQLGDDGEPSGLSFTIKLDDPENAGNITIAGTTPESDILPLVVPKNDLRSITLDSATGEYTIDLNRFVSDIKTYAVNSPLLNNVLSKFSATDKLRVDATVSTSTPHVPATAKAYLVWPTKVPKISLYITNPSTTAYESEKQSKKGNIVVGSSASPHIKGTYTLYEPELVNASGAADMPNPPSSWSTGTKSYDVTTASAIGQYNVDETRQAYLGGSVELSEALDMNVNLKASACSYSTESTSHQYQISEIWLGVNKADGTSDFQRVGYLNQNKWQWQEDGNGVKTEWATLFDTCAKLEGTDDALTSVLINSDAMSKAWPIDSTDGSDGYEIYVRTTPMLSDVHTWFTANMNQGSLIGNDAYQSNRQYQTSIVGYLEHTDTTGSRGQNHGWGILQPFENEFGAPSTVALWQVTKKEGTSIAWKDGGYPAQGDVRVYYSATPAVAWSDGKYTLASTTNALPSAALWLYKAQDNYAASPEALVQGAGDALNNFHLAKSDSADFEIPYNSDDLFYRALKYEDADGKTIGDVQYVPYTVQNNPDYAMIRSYTPLERLDFWQALDNEGNLKQFKPDDLVGVAGIDLPKGAVTLQAKLHEQEPPVEGDTSIGLVYVYDGDKGLMAEGYFGGKEGVFEDFAVKKGTPQQGSYYIAVEANLKNFDFLEGGSEFKATDTYNVRLGGKNDVVLYKIDLKDLSNDGKKVQTVKLSAGNKNNPTVSPLYYLNVHFAHAVTTNIDIANSWGTEKSPWLVEYASQFPGAQSTATQETVKADHFLQLRDIDFSETEYAGFSKEFSGTYDGDDHQIKAAQNILGTMPIANKYSRSAAGLFPRTSGATLQNIQTVFSDPTIIYGRDDNSPVVYFGGLVGYASNGTIENCSVSSSLKGGTTVQLHSLRSTFDTDPDNAYNAAGALAARTKLTTVTDCFANGVRFSLQTENGEWNSANSRNYFGGLIGVADISSLSGKPLTNLAVANAELVVENSTLGQDKNITLGGVIGRLYVGKTPLTVDDSWGWSASNVHIGVDLGLDRSGISERLYVGSVIGNMAANSGVKVECVGIPTTEVYFTSGDDTASEYYKRDLSTYGPLRGPIPEEDGWAYEPAGLFYIDGTSEGGWDAYGYVAGNKRDETVHLTKPSAAQDPKSDTAQPDLEVGCYYLSLPTDRDCSSSETTTVEKTGVYKIAADEDRTFYKISTNTDATSQYYAVKLPVTGGIDRPVTSTYYVNPYFANAVTTDEAVAQTWGTTGNPWQIALAKQFPGALPQDKQNTYLTDSFKQIDNINLADVKDSYKGFASSFKGSYDGNHFVIAQSQYGITTISEDNSLIVCQGLFPYVDGGALKNVQLAIENKSKIKGKPDESLNVNLAPPKGSNWNASSGWTDVGCLAGIVMNGSVENCSITGVVPDIDGNDIVKLSFSGMQDITAQVGILVGRATSSTISGCSVRNIALSLNYGKENRVERSDRSFNFGSIVGSIEGKVSRFAILSHSSAERIELATNGVVANKDVCVGGIVGFVGPATRIADDNASERTHAEDVLITFAAGQKLDKVKDTVGALVGRLATNDKGPVIVVDITDVDKRFGNVLYRIDNKSDIHKIERWYGSFAGNVKPRPDAKLVAEAERAAAETAEKERVAAEEAEAARVAAETAEKERVAAEEAEAARVAAEKEKAAQEAKEREQQEALAAEQQKQEEAKQNEADKKQDATNPKSEADQQVSPEDSSTTEDKPLAESKPEEPSQTNQQAGDADGLAE